MQPARKPGVKPRGNGARLVQAAGLVCAEDTSRPGLEARGNGVDAVRTVRVTGVNAQPSVCKRAASTWKLSGNVGQGLCRPNVKSV